MKILVDFLPILLFFVAYKIAGIYVATAVAIAASVIQASWLYYLHGKVETMHKVTLLLIVVVGGLTLALQDPAFIKWKPTLVNWAFALAFIGSGLFTNKQLIRRMMDHAISLPDPVWKNLNNAWALFFASMGALNIYVAYNYAEDTWVNFKLFGMMGLTILFIIAQGFYLVRHLQPEEK